MTEENVFHWDTDGLYQERMAAMPEWAKKIGSAIDNVYYVEIVPGWVRGDYQVAYSFYPESCLSSESLDLYVRVRYSNGKTSKWMPYASLIMRDWYLILEIVEYLLSGNAERVYERFVEERKWKNQRMGERDE